MLFYGMCIVTFWTKLQNKDKHIKIQKTIKMSNNKNPHKKPGVTSGAREG
jgi:hypothetical protein